MGTVYVTDKKGKTRTFGTSRSAVALAIKDARARAAKTGYAEGTVKKGGRERFITCKKVKSKGRYMRMVDCNFVSRYLPGESPKNMPANKRSKGRKSNRKVKRRRYKSTGRKGATLRRGGKGKRVKATRGRRRTSKGTFAPGANYRR